MARYAISQPVTQVEAPRLLTGNGRYTDDVQLHHQTCPVFLRSPHPHADISTIDFSQPLRVIFINYPVQFIISTLTIAPISNLLTSSGQTTRPFALVIEVNKLDC